MVTCRRGVAGFILALAAVLYMAPPARAQSNSNKGAIRGVVLDRADGSPIDDVSVRLQDARTTAGKRPSRQSRGVSLGDLVTKQPPAPARHHRLIPEAQGLDVQRFVHAAGETPGDRKVLPADSGGGAVTEGGC
jgi:hypothetical protein